MLHCQESQLKIIIMTLFSFGSYSFRRWENVLKSSHIYVDTMGINVISKLTILMKLTYFADKMYLWSM
jgi:hypothetical protein